MNYLLRLLILFIFASALQADEVTDALNGMSQSARKITLENGMRILLVRRTFSPTVACYIKYKAGGADETDETAGLAHMLEHMLFKGTRKVGTTDYDREEKYIVQSNIWAKRTDDARRRMDAAKKSKDEDAVKKAEADFHKWRTRLMSLQQAARKYMLPEEDSYIYAANGERGYNAYTTKDLTNYQIELPANRLEIWARLEADRMQNSVLRDFFTEREVVREERRLRVDNVAQGYMLEQFIGAIYGSHPYGRSLIGSMDVIQYLNYDQAMKFYKTYYAPNNTVIAIVGDIDFDSTEALMRKYFSDLKKRAIPERSLEEPVSRKVRIDVEKQGSPIQMLAWMKPSGIEKENMAIEVLSSILAGRNDSRLFRKLVLEDRVASEIGAFTGYPGERYANLFMIRAVPAPGKTYDDVEKGIIREVENIRKTGITEDELNRVKTSQIAEFMFGLRSNAELADNLTYFELLFGDYKLLFQKIKELQDLKVKDINDAAVKFLATDRMSSARLKPKVESKTESKGEE